MQFDHKCQCGCGHYANVYAMGANAGDYGGYFTLGHLPTGFQITDYL